jgi:hypothetical protein
MAPKQNTFTWEFPCGVGGEHESEKGPKGPGACSHEKELITKSSASPFASGQGRSFALQGLLWTWVRWSSQARMSVGEGV